MPTILIAFRPDLITAQHLARIKALLGDNAESVITEDKENMEIFVEKLRRYRRGEALTNVVDKRQFG